VDLFLESRQVRDTVERTAFTGKTYNSLEHIRQFFTERGQAAPAEPAGAGKRPGPVPPAAPAAPVRKPPRRKGLSPGAAIEHPVYGKGTVMRREGEGDDTKITVRFPGYGLKKLVLKYAGLKIED
jgi:DNA helicase-2/ATP-dependent DNA helicase PcrA